MRENNPPIEKQLLNIKETAEFLSVSESTVKRLRETGELRPVRVRRNIRWRRSDLMKYIQRL